MRISIFCFVLQVCLLWAAGSVIQSTPRSIGDGDSTFQRYPYHVVLRLYNYGNVLKSCGGTRIRDKIVLTAAECVDETQFNYATLIVPQDPTLSNSHVLLDSLDFFYPHLHPNYDRTTGANNIALFTYATVHDSHPSIRNSTKHARLPSSADINQDFATRQVEISSWEGIDKRNSSAPPMFKLIKSEVMRTWLCNAYHSRYTSWVNQYHICASGEGGKVLPKGSAGSPMVLKDHDEYTVIGVSSSVGPPDSNREYPIVFTRVTKYLEWINTTVEALLAIK